MVRDQWAFTSLPLLWLGRYLPIAVVFAVAEALCLGLAVVPLWRMAREVARLRLGATIGLTLAYCAAPVLYTANLTGLVAAGHRGPGHRLGRLVRAAAPVGRLRAVRGHRPRCRGPT